MEDGENARSYEEILKIAEARGYAEQQGPRDTGRSTHGAVGAAQERLPKEPQKEARNSSSRLCYQTQLGVLLL